MDNVVDFIYKLLIDPLYSCFLIVGLGLLLGAIKFKGFSLGVSGVFFVGLIFGFLGFITPKHLTTFGLLLFMYVLGIQGGPTFFNSMSRKGIPYILITLCMMTVSILTVLILGKAFQFEAVDILGIYTGTFNNSSGLAILMEGSWGDKLLPSYGIVYPLGAVGAVILVQLLPIIFRKNTALEFIKHRESSSQKIFASRKFIVENKGIEGKTLVELDFRAKTGATISRLRRGKKIIVPSPDTVFKSDDVILVIGDEDSMDKVKKMVGNETHENMDIDPNVIARQFAIANTHQHNRELSELGLTKTFGVIVTRIQRSGIELPASPDLLLEMGDILTIVGKKRQLEKLEKFMGKTSGISVELDLVSLAIGVSLGIIIGRITIPLPLVGNFTLGITGGALLVGLFLGYAKRFGFLTSQISEVAKNVIKDIGLAFFLAGVGASSGSALIGTGFASAPKMLIISASIITLCVFSIFFLAYKILKMDFVKSLACLCGGMFNSAALGSLVQMAGSDEPTAFFATCYPMATFGSIIATQVLGQILTII